MRFFIFTFIFLLIVSCATTPNKEFALQDLAYQNEIKSIQKDLANGEFLLKRFDYKNSGRYYLKAIGASQKINYNRGIVAGLNNLGVLTLRTNPEQALGYFKKALSKCQYSQDKSDCYNNIGFYYLTLKDNQALDYFEKALKLNKDSEKKYRILNNIGLYYFNEGQNPKARKLFQKVIKASEKKHYYQLQCKSLLNLGDTFLQEDKSKAKEYYKSSLDTAHFWEYDLGMLEALKKIISVIGDRHDQSDLYLYYKALANLHKKFHLEEEYKKDLSILKKIKK